MAVRIYLEIGHEASLRTKKTQEGFTHDWEVFVRGCDGAEIHYYVEKVVFYLHETFPKPKRVIKEPPYSVKESGYAGFNLPIDIYLRNSSEPKKIRFNYDLHLQQSGPPILKVQKEKYVFNNPTDDFKMKVLKGGGSIGGSSSSSSSQEVVSDSRSNLEDKNQLINKPKLSGCDIIKKPKIKPGEPCRDFQELFGSPITMSSKTTSEQKSQSTKTENKPRMKHSPHKDTHKDKEKEKGKDKSESSEKKNKDEKKQKEKSKDRERSKDKNVKKDKSPRPKSPSPSPKKASPPRFSSPPIVKHKESKHDRGEKKDKPEKIKKDKKKEHKSDEQKSGEEHRKSETKKEILKPKTDELKKEKLKEKPPKEEKSHSDKYKHKKKDKEKREKKEEKSYKTEKRPESTKSTNLFKTEPPVLPQSSDLLPPPVKKAKLAPPSFIPNIDDDSSDSSSSSSGSSLIDKKPLPKSETVKLKEDKNLKFKKEKGYQETGIKCKRKSNSVDKHEEPPEKIPIPSTLHSDVEQEKESKPLISTPKEGEEDYFGVLRELQNKIMGLKDNGDLQKIVQLIAETGRFEVSANTFDFDLCLLDRATVQQLQNFFASET